MTTYILVKNSGRGTHLEREATIGDNTVFIHVFISGDLLL